MRVRGDRRPATRTAGRRPATRTAGRRPATRTAVAGLAAHVFYELAAGVGMPTASVVGPVPAGCLWAGATVAGWRGAARWPPSTDAVFTAANGLALAAVVGHFAGWPRDSTWPPWLADCEGLGRELMPAYNAILYVSGTAAAVALATENRRAPVAAALVPLALAPALVAAQHAEFRRLRRLANTQPAWWNRRLQR